MTVPLSGGIDRHVRATRTPPRRDVVALRPLLGLGARTVDRWRRLAERAAEPNPFAGPDTVLAAAAHLPGGRGASLLTVQRDGELTFALPVARYRAHPRMPIPILGVWRRFYPPSATPLLDPEHGVAAWRAIRAALGTRLPAAWLVIDPMNTDGPVDDALRAATDGLTRTLGPQRVEEWQRGAVFRSGGPAASSGRTRRGLERRRRKLAALLDAEPQVGFWTGTDRPPAELTERFLALEAAGWKGRGGTAVVDRPGEGAFFRDMLDRHRANDTLEIVTLHTDDRLVAATVNLCAGDGVFCFKTTYDERFHTCTPGRLLVQDSIRSFFENTDYTFMDSCASPDSQVSNQMFTDRRAVATVLVPGAGASAQTAIRAYRAAQAMKAKLGQVRARSTG